MRINPVRWLDISVNPTSLWKRAGNSGRCSYCTQIESHHRQMDETNLDDMDQSFILPWIYLQPNRYYSSTHVHEPSRSGLKVNWPEIPIQIIPGQGYVDSGSNSKKQLHARVWMGPIE